MTSRSGFWEGDSVGHAASADTIQAPYSAIEFSMLFSKLLGANAAAAYVLPDYANNLNITEDSPASMNVLVGTGAAFIRGRLYECTAQETLAIAAADPTNPRLDRIVLRMDVTAQTITPVVLTGTPAAFTALAMPALTQTAATYEVEIGYVYIAAAATTIDTENIHDTREFVPTFGQINSSYGQTNLIRNSEYMALSGASTDVPDLWTEVGTITSLGALPVGGAFEFTPSMVRGRFLSLSAGAGEGMSQTFHVKPSTTYVIKVAHGVGVAGDISELKVTTDAASPVPISRYGRRYIGAASPFTLFDEKIVYTTEADATEMTVSLLTVGTDVLYCSQVLAQEGYIAGPYRQFHEELMFDKVALGLTDTSWDGDAKSSGGVVIDLTSSYSARILPGTKGLFLTVEANDSGSAAGTPSLDVRGGVNGSSKVITQLGGVVNDQLRENNGKVGLDFDITASLTFLVSASGAGTLDADIRIVGIST